MGKNPYSDLPKSAFWKTGVAQENPYAIEGIYKKKFDIPANAKIATAGSCFAQHISRHLKKNGYNVLDVEPPPPGLPENLHQKFGFSMYSARYGNIYTLRQLLQLAQEVSGEWTPQNYIWERNGKFYDALRPAVEPEGLDSPEEVIEHRQFHISRVKELFETLDLFIFTLGLTEMWVHKESGTVYPTAPGTLIGEFNEDLYEFNNAQFNQIIGDFNLFQRVLKKIRCGKQFKCILTVSPVPLTATASGNHVLLSTNYSKSTLRSVAGQLSTEQAHIDYFPSYEIVTNPRMHSTSFSDNLRSVRNETVETVMSHFFTEHPPTNFKTKDLLEQENIMIQCEEELTELFSNKKLGNRSGRNKFIEIYGRSHTKSFVESIQKNNSFVDQNSLKVIHGLLQHPSFDYLKPFEVSDLRLPSPEKMRPWVKACADGIKNFNSKGMTRSAVVFVGVLHGDSLFRFFGLLGDDVKTSPVIPIIKSKDEIDSSFYEAAEKQVSRHAFLAKKLLCQHINVFHVLAPMIYEDGGRARFGDDYVDSGSQSIYNDAYEDVIEKVFGGDMKRKVIISHDSSFFVDNGFLNNKFAANSEPQQIHASAEFYDSSVRVLLERIDDCSGV